MEYDCLLTYEETKLILFMLHKLLNPIYLPRTCILPRIGKSVKFTLSKYNYNKKSP